MGSLFLHSKQAVVCGSLAALEGPLDWSLKLALALTYDSLTKESP